ncbi:hypothetical protein AB0M92_10485 [Streptomyces sp. NPDC051582]|uniref:hypothetical protein n=1 Tax=Streptomyces sp. NPDC051582 TaxID=3155167 RepID=UPI0034288D6C
MNEEREAHVPATREPELPPRVPENEDALTPDLPPLDPPAPDLRAVKDADGGGSEPQAENDHPAEDPAPQEPTA